MYGESIVVQALLSQNQEWDKLAQEGAELLRQVRRAKGLEWFLNK